MKQNKTQFLFKGLLAILFYFLSGFNLFTNADLFGLSLDLSTNYIHLVNEDFQNYDEAKYRENKSVGFLNTDDRAHILYGNLNLKFDTQYKNTKFFIDMSRQGYWGTDNFQGRDGGQNPILINRLYFIYYLFEGFSLHFGRHRYEIGDARLDYFFSDVIDGLQVSYQILDMLKLNILADVVAIAERPDNAGIFSVVRKDDEELEDFQGDTLTFRTGFYLDIDVLDYVNLKPFSYFLRYGATTEGGSDISENGRGTLNKADNDFVVMSGLRISKQYEKFGNYDLTFAYSYGKDSQFNGERVYNGFGLALNYGYDYTFLEKFRIQPALSFGYFHPDFAAMKARSPAGTLLWGIKSYHASPYAYFYHFRDYGKRRDSITFVDRTNSKTFLRLGNDFKYDKIGLDLHFLFLFETKSKELPNTEFSYMGTEIEIELSYTVSNLKFTLTNALYVPTDYYQKRTHISNSLPPGKDIFYAVLFNTSYVLDLDFISAFEKEDDEEKKKDRTGELLGEEDEAIE